MKRTKSGYENDIKTMLVGKRLTGVRYFEIRYNIDKPFYINTPFPGHLLDFGCDLEFSDGTITGIIWDNEYFSYGIGAFNSSLSNILSDCKIWEVSNEANWTKLIDTPIKKIKIHWSWARYEGKEEQDYPQDLEVEFENSSIVIFSASQYQEDKDVLWGMSDDIAVIFDIDVAKRYRVGSYAKKQPDTEE